MLATLLHIFLGIRLFDQLTTSEFNSAYHVLTPQCICNNDKVQKPKVYITPKKALYTYRNVDVCAL